MFGNDTKHFTQKQTKLYLDNTSLQEFYFDSFVKFMDTLLKYETFSTNRRWYQYKFLILN